MEEEDLRGKFKSCLCHLRNVNVGLLVLESYRSLFGTVFDHVTSTSVEAYFTTRRLTRLY